MNTTSRRVRAAAVVALATGVLFCAFTSSARTTGSSLGDAIALYEEARYADALDVLNGLVNLAPGASIDASQVRVAEYQALCLLALDRPAEARAVVWKLLERRPDYRPEPGQFPPRFVAVVQETRAGLLPGAVRTEYRLGKARYDEKSYPLAEGHFRKVVRLLDDESVPPEVRQALADVRDLAEGFLALIPEPPALPAVVSERPPSLAARPAPPPPAFYTAADAGVRPPIAVRQDMPPWRTGFEDWRHHSSRGTLELIVDERGRVASARLAAPVDPLYDARLLSAARRWQYEPATKDGQPVKFKKIIAVRVDGPAANRIP